MGLAKVRDCAAARWRQLAANRWLEWDGGRHTIMRVIMMIHLLLLLLLEVLIGFERQLILVEPDSGLAIDLEQLRIRGRLIQSCQFIASSKLNCWRAHCRQRVTWDCL